MPLLTKCEIVQQVAREQRSLQMKDEDNCLICRLMRIHHERADVVKWILASDESPDEKTKIATMMTGIKFDEEILHCLEDPSIRGFIFSE